CNRSYRASALSESEKEQTGQLMARKQSSGTLVCFFLVLFLSNKEKAHRFPFSKGIFAYFCRKVLP
ncbi:MAG: hypothetical protein IJD59_00460, partial [Clostridia bacterium]|nr:hypothetical protein [Clostridia bacterium]